MDTKQPHLGRWGRWQGHPYLSQNNVSDWIASRPMRYIYFEVGVSLYLMDPRDHWPVKNSDTLRIFPTAKRILWPARLGRNNLDICQSVMLNASLSCIGYCIYIYSYIYALHWLEIWFENEMFKLISSNKFGGGHPLSLSISLLLVWVGFHKGGKVEVSHKTNSQVVEPCLFVLCEQ